MAYEIVVIGCSWGGLQAIETLLRGLPEDFPVAIAIAQHRSAEIEEGTLVALLQRHSQLPVSEVDDKDPIERGHVYVAPPGYHLLVERGAFALSVDDYVRFARPSIDVLFVSAADAYGELAIGVVLTGANEDGADGLAHIVARGGFAIVQDPETAARPEMPRAAIAASLPDQVLPLEEIPAALIELCDGARAPA